MELRACRQGPAGVQTVPLVSVPVLTTGITQKLIRVTIVMEVGLATLLIYAGAFHLVADLMVIFLKQRNVIMSDRFGGGFRPGDAFKGDGLGKSRHRG